MDKLDDLVRLKKHEPFKAVVLMLSSGEVVAVSRSKQLLVTDTDGVIVTSPGQQPGRMSWRLLGLDDIDAAETIELAD